MDHQVRNDSVEFMRRIYRFRPICLLKFHVMPFCPLFQRVRYSHFAEESCEILLAEVQHDSAEIGGQIGGFLGFEEGGLMEKFS